MACTTSSKNFTYIWKIVDVDSRSEKIGYKIREAQLMKVPYMIVVGEKEQENGTVSIRIGAMKLDEFIDKLAKEVENKGM